MKQIKVLLACGLLLYAASMFLPWFQPSRLGCGTIYWSYKVEYYCTTNPPLYGEVMFFDYWSSCSIGTAFFASQILTILFGLLTLLKKVNKKYELMILGLTLLFLATPIGAIISQSSVLSGFHALHLEFLAGFWIANFAFLLLITTLLISLIKYLRR